MAKTWCKLYLKWPIPDSQLRNFPGGISECPKVFQNPLPVKLSKHVLLAVAQSPSLLGAHGFIM